MSSTMQDPQSDINFVLIQFCFGWLFLAGETASTGAFADATGSRISGCNVA